MKKLILVFFLFGIGLSASAGPFGLEKGMTYEQLLAIDPSISEIAPGYYKLTTVPKPSPAFESYIVQIHPDHGLYFLKAIGKDIETSTYGIELKAEFDRVKKGLIAVYGEPTGSYDYLRPGSLWDEPRDWMISIIKKERVLIFAWGEDDIPITTDIEKVFLGIDVTSTTSGYILIEYYFAGYSEYETPAEEVF